MEACANEYLILAVHPASQRHRAPGTHITGMEAFCEEMCYSRTLQRLRELDRGCEINTRALNLNICCERKMHCI